MSMKKKHVIAGYQSLMFCILCYYWIDFVLVWEEPLNSNTVESTNISHRKWRERFLAKLSHSGLLQEKVSKPYIPGTEST